jgi:hypothetical protein
MTPPAEVPAAASETAGAPAEDIFAELPEDLGSLIGESLSYAAGTPAQRTGPLLLQDHRRDYPNHTAQRFYDTEEMTEAKELVERLGSYGIDIPPSKAVEHRGAGYLITPKVVGERLDQLLVAEDRRPDLLAEVDGLYAKLGNWLCTEAVSRHDLLLDGFNIERYQRGVLAGTGTTEPKLWLANAPTDNIGTEGFGFSVAEFANNVITTERLAGGDARLTAGRALVEQAVELLPAVARHPARVADAVKRALETNTPISQQDMTGIY